jgi:FKBP-type peptidyl-prolyl cis-trans isomerase
MTKMTLREKRRAERTARRRRQRIIFGAILGVIVVVVGLLIYNNLSGGETDTSEESLIVQELAIGTGEAAQVGDTLSVHYTGWLEDGTQFDSSVDRGTPFEFILGEGNVIAGWDEGLVGIQEGGKRKLIIPPDLAYGASGSGPIPPNATLTFEVELLEIK